MIEQVRKILSEGENIKKLTIENWNKPYGHGLINPVNFYTHPKNPNILEVFKQIGRAEELGSGVRNVFRYGNVYGGAEPVFQEGDVFKTIIAMPVEAKEKQEVKTGEGISEGLSEGLNEGLNDAANTQNDTEESKSDTEKFKNDTEHIFSRIIDAVNDAVNAFNVTVNEMNDTIKGTDVTINDTIKPITNTTGKILFNIISFIDKQPGSKAGEIAVHINRSIQATERYIAILRKLNMMEHSGPKNIGGYYLTEKILKLINQ